MSTGKLLRRLSALETELSHRKVSPPMMAEGKPDSKDQTKSILQTPTFTEPEEYLKYFGPVWGKMRDIARSVRDNKITCVRACTSSSKTHTAAGLALWFLDVYRPYSKIITTAKTELQLKTVPWTRIRSYYLMVRDRFGFAKPPKTLSFFPAPGESPDWFMQGFSPKIEAGEATAFQGHHSQSGHVFFIFEEANTIEDPIYDAAMGSYDDPHFHMLCLYNPNVEGGQVYRWEQTGVVSEKIGNLITISRYDLFDDPTYPALRALGGLATPESTEEMVAKYGVDSALIRVKVLGKYPLQSESMAILMSDVERAEDRLDDESFDVGRITEVILSYDPASTDDGDENVLKRLIVGETGYLESTIDAWRGIPDENLSRLYEIIQRQRKIFSVAPDDYDEGKYGAYVPPKIVLVEDAVGVGSHVKSMIESWDPDLEVIAFGGGESGNPLPTEPEVMIYNRISEAWRAALLLLKGDHHNQVAVEADEITKHQLTSRKGQWVKRRGEELTWRVEPKDDWKKRNPGSPDRADAFVMAAWAAIADRAKPEETDWGFAR